MSDKYKSVHVLDDEKNPLFHARETGLTQTPFEIEVIFFNHIKNGNVGNVREMIQRNLKDGIYYGRMSLDNLTQYKYLCVCTISNASHYAILGGFDETEAFNMSAEIIMKIDQSTSTDDMLDILSRFLIDLTQRVHDSRYVSTYSSTVRKCIHYVYINLHNKITIGDLSNYTGLSKSYLSTLFKKEVGVTIASYIVKEKLEAAKLLLLTKPHTSSVGYYFGFCTESYFISLFKKEYGITPKAFVKKNF